LRLEVRVLGRTLTRLKLALAALPLGYHLPAAVGRWIEHDADSSRFHMSPS
jgi:hypothetical protein